MPKAKLEFNLPEEKEEFARASKATDAYVALWDIQQYLFRPARKHGYSNPELEELIEATGTYIDPQWGETNRGREIIERLEKMFYQILEENNIDLAREMT